MRVRARASCCAVCIRDTRCATPSLPRRHEIVCRSKQPCLDVWTIPVKECSEDDDDDNSIGVGEFSIRSRI